MAFFSPILLFLAALSFFVGFAAASFFLLGLTSWLSRSKVSVFMLDYDGSLISSILPPAPVKADLRAAQLKASEDERKEFTIANAIVRAKVARSLQVLSEWHTPLRNQAK